LTRDGYLLFLTRFLRLFACGSLSVVLVFYLVSLGLNESQTGLLLTLTLLGDTVISLYLTTRADRIGRRRMLIVGAILMAAAGLAFACTRNLFFLIIAGTIGVISPSGNEVGPFLSIEQAALAHVVPDQWRTEVFAWYTLAGSVATAIGALFAGMITNALQRTAMTPVATYRVVVLLYAVIGVLLVCLFISLSPAAEVYVAQEESSSPMSMKKFFGVGRSHRVVVKLSSLFALDSFAGGFVVQSFAAYWFYLRFGVNPATLGVIFFLGKHICRNICPGGLTARCEMGPGQHHGLYAPAFQHSVDSSAADAKSKVGCPGSSHPLHHQPDGCSREAVVHHGSGQ
jgi:MFS family permease